MTTTWESETPPIEPRIKGFDWVRVVWRGVTLGIVTFGCLGLLLLVRLIERPIFGLRRPITPYITQFVCRMAFVILRIPYKTTGQLMKEPGAVVANHVSWLDIFTLNARKRIYFVSKSEVASWPGIGWLARATGTVFIARDRREAKAQTKLFEDRLHAGHKLLFFPEGTSTDGRRVITFKPTLFQAFMLPPLKEELHIQPVTVVYRGTEEDPRFYGWWGEMEFGGNLLKVLAAKKQGSVEVIYHKPVAAADFADRKEIAKYCEETVRSGLPADWPDY
ncbi:lysophospholipid acyltransferase family protein [Actibacterium pelagium]|uniref:1-acyl-sn-glycerol-3-phosphate acyltransferase n=1 Tax=Actibacterium pelagium TaxID=2029103 RepID=A0A917AF52_9RHOB|nr:lysophospholipid acyltransferase family protein [Actibacterium pelagium]GGE44048.1 1-acyl-sn-glycerol-3-phosphate acyltransferase [Actibacterium pelagium]